MTPSEVEEVGYSPICSNLPKNWVTLESRKWFSEWVFDEHANRNLCFLFQLISIYGKALKATEEYVKELKSKQT